MGLRYGEGYGGGSYVVSSVSKVKSSSLGGARREQGAGSSGRVSPDFRERKAVSSRSGGYDGESWHQLSLKERKRSQRNELLTFLLLLCLCFLLGSSSANSSPEFTRKDYGIYCKFEQQLGGITLHRFCSFFFPQRFPHDTRVYIFVFPLFCPFSGQVPVPQEGGVKAEVFSEIWPLLPLIACGLSGSLFSFY